MSFQPPMEPGASAPQATPAMPAAPPAATPAPASDAGAAPTPVAPVPLPPVDQSGNAESAFESFGSFDQSPAPSPLPTAAVPKDGAIADKTVEPVAAKTDAPSTPTEDQPAPAVPSEGQPPAAPAVDGDPELTATEQAAVQAAPEAERPALADKLKHASFMSHYRSSRPINEVAAELQKRSGARYNELTSHIVSEQLANPREFVQSQIKSNPEGFSKFLEDVIEGDDKFVGKVMTGEEVGRDEIRSALEFQNRYKDKAAELSDVKTFSESELEKMELVLDPETFEAVKRNAELAAQADPAMRQKAEGGANKTEKPGDEAGKQEPTTPQGELMALDKDQSAVFDQAYGSIRSYLDNKLDTQYKLAVTEQEWADAPEMAALKTIKRHLLYEGDGDGLPDFTTGLVEYGKEKAGFEDGRKDLFHFSRAKEQQNALSAGNRLRPFADQYMDDRLKMPLFQILDRVMTVVASGQQVQEPQGDPLRIPGAPSSGGGGARTAEEAFESFRPL